MVFSRIVIGKPPKHIKNILRKKRGRLIVKEYVGRCGLKYYVKVKCSCGNEKIIDASNLIWGTTVSCGCYAVEQTKKYYNKLHGA